MKLVYVSSPYAGDVKTNTKNAQEYCHYVANCGHAPVAVHLLYPQFLDDTNCVEREMGINMGLRVLCACDELWVFGDTLSAGMQKEVAEAKRLGIPVVHQNIVNERMKMQMCL